MLMPWAMIIPWAMLILGAAGPCPTEKRAAPPRPAKHPEILTLALPRPSPKDFDPCPTPPRPKGKKNLPRPSLVGTRKSQNFTSLPMTPGQHQQGLSQLKKVPSFPTRPGIPHLVAPKTGHCPPNLPQIWCCLYQLQPSTTEHFRFCLIKWYYII